MTHLGNNLNFVQSAFFRRKRTQTIQEKRVYTICSSLKLRPTITTLYCHKKRILLYSPKSSFAENCYICYYWLTGQHPPSVRCCSNKLQSFRSSLILQICFCFAAARVVFVSKSFTRWISFVEDNLQWYSEAFYDRC